MSSNRSEGGTAPRGGRRRPWVVWPALGLAVALGLTAWKLLPLLDRGRGQAFAADDGTPVPSGPCQAEKEKRRAKDKTVLLYYGDAGSGEPAQYAIGRRMARVCHERCCDAAVVAGDNIYPSGVTSADDPQFETKFERPFAPTVNAQGKPLHHYLSLGNHDARGNIQGEIDRTRKSTRWRMPSRYYQVPNLPSYLAVFALDTNDRSGPQGEQGRWLAQAACASKARWKFYLGHHPVVSLGAHGANKHTGYLLDVARRCGVTGYLAGHDHDLQHVAMAVGQGQRFEQFVSGGGTWRRDDVPICAAHRPGGDPNCQKAVSRIAGQVKAQGAVGPEVLFGDGALGFAVLEASEARLEMTYYDVDGRELYRWTQTPPAVAAE
jgi:acid phosphatase